MTPKEQSENEKLMNQHIDNINNQVTPSFVVRDSEAREIAEKVVANELDDGIEDWSGVVNVIEKALLEYGRREREKAIRECAEIARKHRCLEHPPRAHSEFMWSKAAELVEERILSLLKSDERKREKGDEK